MGDGTDEGGASELEQSAFSRSGSVVVVGGTLEFGDYAFAATGDVETTGETWEVGDERVRINTRGVAGIDNFEDEVGRVDIRAEDAG